MSDETFRQELADALSTVADVRGHTYRPTVPKIGDAWPTLPSIALEQGLVWRPVWTVQVLLPSNERDASKWIDAHWRDLVLALRGPAFPELVEPALLETSGGVLFVLEITLRSE